MGYYADEFDSSEDHTGAILMLFRFAPLLEHKYTIITSVILLVYLSRTTLPRPFPIQMNLHILQHRLPLLRSLYPRQLKHSLFNNQQKLPSIAQKSK